jgi:hypothetical protein
MTETHDGFPRGRRWAVMAVALALAATVALASAPGAQARAPRAHAGEWVGTATGKLARATKFLGAGATMQGDFSFRLTRRGHLSGYATVSYEPTFDTAGLDALINYAKGAVGSVLGIIPYVGGFANNQLSLLIGVRVSYDELLPVRRGRIVGDLRGDRLSIRWAGGKPAALGFRAYFITLKGRKPLTRGSIPAQDPWNGTAQVLSRSLVVATPKPRDGRTAKGAREQVSNYWSAHRVG